MYRMTTLKLPHYLYQRANTWWFRKTIPTVNARHDIRLSLKTKQLHAARSLALILNSQYNHWKAQYSGSPKMTKEHIAFFQQQLKLLVNRWWQREMDDFHGNLDKGIDELNDLQHVATGLIEFHHKRIIKKEYRDNAKNQRIAATLLDEIQEQQSDITSNLTEQDYQQLALMVDQASLQHYQRLNTYLSNPTPDWLNAPTTFEVESIIDDKPRYPLSKLISEYQEESRQKGHSQKTQNKYAQCLALAISYFGDVLVDTITPEQGRHFRECLKTFPLGIKTKEMLAQPLSEIIKKHPRTQIISVETANSHLQKVSQFFDWIVSLGYLTYNPIPQEPLPAPRVNHKDDRAVITDEEAIQVFQHPLFTMHQGVKTKKIQQPYHFWLPLLCLFTGMRPGEACQLFTNDIEKVNDIWCIRVDNRYEKQRLKTPNAKRYIPIHQQLIDLGFLVFVNDKAGQDSQNTRLFPEIMLIQDSFATKPGEWFNRNLRDRRSLPEHVTLYSFRHYFRDKLLALHPSDEYLNKIMGHQTSSYGKALPKEQQAMHELVNKLDFSAIIVQVKPYETLDIFH